MDKPALSCEMTGEEHIRARAMIILNGNKLIVAVVRSPKILIGQKNLTEFLHSLRF
ncbi:MAG TPA: hypothetical protein VGL56_17950 [Fimbriimonadaceae bacterium]|jgi:hypothetical protein